MFIVKRFLSQQSPFAFINFALVKTPIRHLSSTSDGEMDLTRVVKSLEGFASRSLAEGWDNVGLLIEPSSSKVVRKIALTNDLTSVVMAECVEKKVDLIISYHPPIFKAFKRLTLANWKDQIVISCIANNIALYSPHTSFDAVAGGVNDWLIKPYGSGTVEPIQPSKNFENGMTHQVSIRVDSSMVDMASSVLASFDGIAVKKFEAGNFDITCRESQLPPLMQLFAERAGLFNDVRIIKLEKIPINHTGMGRKVKLDSSLTLKEAVETTKNHLQLKHLRLALGEGKTLDSEVTTVAVCGGSGGSLFAGVSADLLVTGEMSHHEVLDAVHAGSSVILCEHSNTERGYLTEFAQRLVTMLDNKVEVFVAEEDHERLIIV